MKKICLGIIMVLFGIISGLTLFCTFVGLFMGIDIVLFYGIPAAICTFITIKLYKKFKTIKVEVKKKEIKVVKEEKPVEQKVVKEEKPVEQKVVKEEKPVEQKVVNIKDFKQEKENATNETEKPKSEERVISERTEKIAAVVGKVIGCLICVGMVVGAIALVVLLINFGIYIIGFLVKGLLFIAAVGLVIWLASAFLKYWWFLVKWEHVYPRRKIRKR